MPVRAGLVAAVLAACTLAFATCGGRDTEEDRVAAAIEAMQEDMAAGRVGAVCAAMTARPQRQIGSIGHGRKPTTCERDVRELVLTTEATARADEKPGLRGTPKPDVVAVDVDPTGRRAVATVTLGTRPFRVKLAKEGGSWKLNDFFGALAPPPRDLR